METSIFLIYESPGKSEVIYVDISNKEDKISPEWIFCRVASEDDTKRLNKKDRVQLKEKGCVVKRAIKMSTSENPSNRKLNT